ncbi:hypothetical protein P7C73_g1576, partial [Tremellales sp. Uapishka_1]
MSVQQYLKTELFSVQGKINALAKESGLGGEVIAIQADISNKAGISAFYDKASKHIDALDLLVNNAGFSNNWRVQAPWSDPTPELEAKLWSIEDGDFAAMTGIHVAAPYFLAIKFLPMLKRSKDASIVNITSMGALFLNRACCEFAYAQSKAAEEHLTRLMAASLMPFKVRVNSVIPGMFPSQLTTTPDGTFFPPQQIAIKSIPKGRAGLLVEIAGPIMLFATPAGAYLNGISLIVDGGWMMTASANDV